MYNFFLNKVTFKDSFDMFLNLKFMILNDFKFHSSSVKLPHD